MKYIHNITPLLYAGDIPELVHTSYLDMHIGYLHFI